MLRLAAETWRATVLVKCSRRWTSYMRWNGGCPRVICPDRIQCSMCCCRLSSELGWRESPLPGAKFHCPDVSVVRMPRRGFGIDGVKRVAGACGLTQEGRPAHVSWRVSWGVAAGLCPRRRDSGMEKMLGEYGRRRLYSGLGPMGTPTTTAAVCVGEEAESLTYTVDWRGCVGGRWKSASLW